MSGQQSEQCLNFAGTVRLVLTRFPWRYVVKLTNPQISNRTFKGLLTQRNLDDGMVIDDIRWLMSTCGHFVLQFDDATGELDYGVFRVRLLSCEESNAVLTLEFAADDPQVDFSGLFLAIDGKS